MAVPSVIDADEWLLDGTRWPLIGPLQVATLTVLPPRIATGPTERDQEQIRSSLILEDWAGGLGLANPDAGATGDRYAFGTLDTTRRLTAGLPQRTIDASAGAPANTRLRCLAVYNNTVYGAWDRKVRFWAEGGATWSLPTGAGYVDLAAAGTQMWVMRIATKDWLVVADGTGYLKFDGTTWSYTAGNDTTIPRAQWLCDWDSRLWTIDPNGVLWVTDDLLAWTEKAFIPLPAGEVRGLLIGYDTNDNAILHAASRTGLWLYNADADRFENTRASFPYDPAAGAAVAWRGDLYIAAGADVYNFTGHVFSPMGLSRDDGLPRDARGNVGVLANSHNWMIASVDGAPAPAGTLTRTTCSNGWRCKVRIRGQARAMLYVWTGSSWHPRWMAGTFPTPISCVAAVRQPTGNRLWWGAGAQAFYQALPQGMFNPRDDPYWHGSEQSGYLVTTWFTGGRQEVPKLAVDFELALRFASATATGAVDYALDGSLVWLPLLTQTTDRATPTVFGDGAGTVFHSIRFRIALATVDPMTPPDYDFGVLTYVPELRRLYSVTAAIDLSQLDSPRQFERALQVTIEKQALLESSFRRKGQAVGPQGRVLLLKSSGSTGSGPATEGRWTLEAVSLA